MEILRGWGSQKPKFYKKSTGLNWNFQRGGVGGGGVKPKNLLWEGYGYFLELHNIHATPTEGEEGEGVVKQIFHLIKNKHA